MGEGGQGADDGLARSKGLQQSGTAYEWDWGGWGITGAKEGWGTSKATVRWETKGAAVKYGLKRGGSFQGLDWKVSVEIETGDGLNGMKRGGDFRGAGVVKGTRVGCRIR